MATYPTIRDVIKEIMEIEMIVDFKPVAAKERLTNLVRDLRRETQEGGLY
ncbi:hypothetical protein LCGC14_1569840 [marine sediment metagenome]|uniref:Uncharacterized protein n=1 Tax=marine sediment metagenome TaxID=412755 RepID=A0A0F9IK48_9ZZZZ